MKLTRDEWIQDLKRRQKEAWEGPVTRPSNGTEAADWECHWCELCAHYIPMDVKDMEMFCICEKEILAKEFCGEVTGEWRAHTPSGMDFICRSWKVKDEYITPENQEPLPLTSDAEAGR